MNRSDENGKMVDFGFGNCYINFGQWGRCSLDIFTLKECLGLCYSVQAKALLCFIAIALDELTGKRTIHSLTKLWVLEPKD